jgi:hypothetical protein
MQLKGHSIMSDETKNVMKMPEVVDGFDTQNDTAQGRRVIQGTRLAFTNDFMWVDNNEEETPKDREFLVVDRARVLQKWSPDGTPIAGETRFLEPGEKWPDVAAMNEAAPKSEWREGPNGLQGPWQCQHVIYLLDPQTLDKFTYPTNTTGGHIAVGELSDKIKNMRRLRGAHVYPVVTLADTFMNTRYGGRQRPHFLIKRWVLLGPSETALPAPPEGPQPLNTAAAEKPAEHSAPIELRTIKEPTLSEEMDDDIPSKGEGSKSGRKVLSSPKIVAVQHNKKRRSAG